MVKAKGAGMKRIITYGTYDFHLLMELAVM